MGDAAPKQKEKGDASLLIGLVLGLVIGAAVAIVLAEITRESDFGPQAQLAEADNRTEGAAEGAK